MIVDMFFLNYECFLKTLPDKGSIITAIGCGLHHKDIPYAIIRNGLPRSPLLRMLPITQYLPQSLGLGHADEAEA